ncbi:MAG: hypothetical protein WA996_21610 [Candidatus Promineifilaceae bacterium]
MIRLRSDNVSPEMTELAARYPNDGGWARWQAALKAAGARARAANPGGVIANGE